jgi:hypothetical protein
VSIDWNAIITGAVSAASNAVKTTAPQVQDFLREIASGHENALIEIGEAFARGDIEKDTFKSELDDEAETLKIELQAVAVLTKAIAQRAINAFRTAFLDALGKALKVAL